MNFHAVFWGRSAKKIEISLRIQAGEKLFYGYRYTEMNPPSPAEGGALQLVI